MFFFTDVKLRVISSLIGSEIGGNIILYKAESPSPANGGGRRTKVAGYMSLSLFLNWGLSSRSPNFSVLTVSPRGWSSRPVRSPS